MLNFKKLPLLTAVFALILSLSFSTSFAQKKKNKKEVKTYKLKVEVVDAESGNALPNTKIAILGSDIQKKTGENGVYTFEKFPAGPHTVTIESDGYQTWKKTVTVKKESKLTVKLKPQPTS